MSETSACVFWSCILFTVSYYWFILGVLAYFVLALLWYFLFFFCGLLIFFIKSVKTGSRLLSVTLPLHNSSSGSVTGTRAIARGQVCQKRSEGEIYAAAQAERRSASSCDAFYLSTGDKPDSINVSQEVIRFCFSKRNIFQPRLDSGNNVPLCCKTFPRRYPRSLEQLHTHVFGFLLKSQIMQDQSLCAFHLDYL